MARQDRCVDLSLPKAVLKQLGVVKGALRVPAVHALWLSGSAARGQLRHSSDIDWVLITEIVEVANHWPSDRHSFQVYGADAFLRSVGEGHEFAMWQLAYGRPVYVSNEFHHRLIHAPVAPRSIAVRRKLVTLSRRQRLIDLLLKCEALPEVRREVMLLGQQCLRVEIMKAGYVPGCRAEIENQLAVISPHRFARWKESTEVWRPRPGRRSSGAMEAAAAFYIQEARAA